MKTIFRNFISVARHFKLASLLNILGLSVAFAAFIMILIQVHYELSYNDCHSNKDRIYRLEASLFGNPYQAVSSRPVAEALAQNEAHTAAMALSMPWGSEVHLRLSDANGQDQYFRETAVKVQPDYTRIFDFEFTDGTGNSLEDPNQILLPESLALKYFGTVFAAGKSMEMDGTQRVIGGVFKDFPKNSTAENRIYLPIPKDQDLNQWGNWSYHAYFMLDNPQAAEHYLDHLIDYIDYAEYGYESKEALIEEMGSQSFFRLTPLKDIYFNNDVIFDTSIHGSRQTLVLLISIAICVLVIAAINYTNFSTALTPMRIRSINTQKVLGSTNAMLRGSLLTEAALTSLLSFVISLLMILAAKGSFIERLITPDLDFKLYAPLMAQCGLLSLAIGLIAGLYPAFHMTSFSPALVLKGSFGLSGKGTRLRRVLLCVQFVASLALIVISLFMFLQNKYMSKGSIGYDRDRLVVAWINDNVTKSRDAFTNRVKSFNSVETVAYADRAISLQDDYSTRQATVHDQSLTYTTISVTPDFLKVLGLTPLEGRDFLPEDQLHSYDGVFLMNQTSLDLYNVAVGDSINGNYVAGIFPDIKFATFKRQVGPLALCIYGNKTWFAENFKLNIAYIRLRADADPQEAVKHIQSVLKEFDPVYPFDVSTLNQCIDTAYSKDNDLARLVSLFGLLAVLLSVVGVFGLVVFESEHKRKEIGIRKVFGSTSSQILRQSGGKYLPLLLVSSVIAFPVSYIVVNRWLERFAFRIPIQAWVFVAAFVAVALVTLGTVMIQNWRAANENPIKSLRSE